MKKSIISTLFISLFILLCITDKVNALSFSSDFVEKKTIECQSNGGFISQKPFYNHDGSLLWMIPACNFSDGTTCDLLSTPQCRPSTLVACPAIYAPVCGDISDRVRCITAPCIAERTYSNECMLNADGAKKISDGECKSVSTKPSFCNASYIKLVRGSRGDYVRGLQEYLRDQGYNPGTIDGVFGRQVAAAVKTFQKNNGLVTDGVFGKGSRAKVCAMF